MSSPVIQTAFHSKDPGHLQDVFLPYLPRILLTVQTSFSHTPIIFALFAFSFSMLEVSDSLILAQKSQHFPITRAIFELSQILGSGSYTACAFGVWTMLFLCASIAAAGVLLGKKLGSIFRL